MVHKKRSTKVLVSLLTNRAKPFAKAPSKIRAISRYLHHSIHPPHLPAPPSNLLAANTMPFIVSRVALRRTRLPTGMFRRRANVRNATTEATTNAGQPDQAKGQMEKASQGLSRVTSSAGNVSGRIGGMVNSIGGRTGRMINFVQCEWITEFQ